jgi:hypothetical protein
MSEKSVLKLKIENVRPGIGDQLVECPLFAGQIFLEQCVRVTQTIDAVYHQVLIKVITAQELHDAPACANGLIPEKLRAYAEKIVELKKDWGECNGICKQCQAVDKKSPIIGSELKVDHPGLMPVNYTSQYVREE